MKHPNRRAFSGVLTRIGVPSDKAPSGSRGHRVCISREAAEAALSGLVGMGLCYRPKWDGHDTRRKIGVLTTAGIAGRDIVVRGYIFARDFADVIGEMPNLDLGMSYEAADCLVDDFRASVWTVTRISFTGAAVLLRSNAAYKDTNFRLEEICRAS